MKINARTSTAGLTAATLVTDQAACSGGGAQDTNSSNTGGGGGDSGYTFAMVTHESPGDTFWDRIKAGANQAAKDTGSTLKYSADPDATKQAVLIQNAIDSKVDGIATTLVTPDALIPPVKKAVAAGIPGGSLNSGLDFYQPGRAPPARQGGGRGGHPRGQIQLGPGLLPTGRLSGALRGRRTARRPRCRQAGG